MEQPKPEQHRREARIVRVGGAGRDAQERERLLDRVLLSDGRGAISRAADAYRKAGFAFPERQDVQLQLLEQFDDGHVRQALDVMAQLLLRQSPQKRPVLEQRLRRLEENADDVTTRDAAGVLRRSLK